MTSIPEVSGEARAIGDAVERFVRERIVPLEPIAARDHHGCPTSEFAAELREMAGSEGLLTPHIRADGSHLSQVDTAYVLIRSGLSILGPLAFQVGAPDEGNMYLLGKVGSDAIKGRFLEPLVEGHATSAFFMTEPAEDGGAGSDPSMMQTTCRRDGDDWIVEGRKCFITSAASAQVGIVMARSIDPESEGGACMFLVDLPDPAITIEDVPATIDSSMPGGHATVRINGLRIPADQMLGDPGEGFRYAQIRLAPARLSHCMRWLGGAIRAQEIATDYACRRQAFGKTLIDHEGVGFMLAENQIDLKQAELMVYWCAASLDAGENGNIESSMTKVAVSEALMRVADRCVQVMGGTGVTGRTMVEQLYREIRAFRIYDGPTEVHKWSLAKKIKHGWAARQGA